MERMRARFSGRYFEHPTVDFDCACKLFRRAALQGLAVQSGGAFFSAELMIKFQASGKSVAEVGVPRSVPSAPT